MILEFEARVRDGSVSLADLALTESDCSSARKRGDLLVSPSYIYRKPPSQC